MITPQSAALESVVSDQSFTPRAANDSIPSLRQEAMACDASSREELPLARLWLELVSGTCRVVDAFFSENRCYLVTQEFAPRSKRPRDRRCLLILEAILRGASQKSVSFDSGLAPSTIAANAQDALALIGLDSVPSRAHPLLILAASAAGEHDDSVTGALSFPSHGGESFRVLSSARPEFLLAPQLPPAELDVVRCLVEGYSHASIARLRGTSQRTVANQIASVFRRLGVTCRMELVHRLFELSSVYCLATPALRLAATSEALRRIECAS